MFIKYSISEILRFLIFCNICRIVEKPGWRFRIEYGRLLQWRGEKVYLDADGTTYFPTNLSLPQWLPSQLGKKHFFSWNLWHLKSHCLDCLELILLKSVDSFLQHFLSIKPCKSFSKIGWTSLSQLPTASGTFFYIAYTSFIDNSIFHLSLELLTKFWKTSCFSFIVHFYTFHW